VLDKSSGRLTLTAIKPDGTVEGSMNSRDTADQRAGAGLRVG
jgi:hypothetical protein